MRVIISSLLLTLLYFSAYSQNYIDYFIITSQADSMIVLHQDFESALEKYNYAFEEFDKHFAQDLYNAAICASLLEKDSLANRYLIEILQKGISVDFLRSKAELRKYLDSTKDNINPRETIRNNSDLFKKLKEIDDRDQMFRVGRGYREKYGDQIDSVHQINVKEVKEILKKYGYPDEDVIGTETIIFKSPIDIVFLHDAQRHQESFFKKLHEEIKNGRFHPQKYSAYFDFYYRGTDDFNGVPYYGHDVYYMVNKVPYCYDLSNKDLRQINTRRRSIGLLGYETYKMMVEKYRLLDNSFIFNFSYAKQIMNVPEQHQDKLLQKLKKRKIAKCN